MTLHETRGLDPALADAQEALGDIVFGIFFFVIGQVILYVFGDTICDGIQHYLDGLFFATICNLLAVMMVYKVRIPPFIK